MAPTEERGACHDGGRRRRGQMPHALEADSHTLCWLLLKIPQSIGGFPRRDRAIPFARNGSHAPATTGWIERTFFTLRSGSGACLATWGGGAAQPFGGCRCGTALLSRTKPAEPEISEATRMAVLAAFSGFCPANDNPPMNSETVKPIPASTATQASWPHRIDGGIRARPSFTVTQQVAIMPIGFPSTSPRITPHA